MAEPDGLLAVGGDLSPERLLLAYSRGIFPWFNTGDPFLWWSPMPRCVLLPGDLHISRSLRKTLRRPPFHLSFDCAFPQVIRACATCSERAAVGTWITDEMMSAYECLHTLGFAHSVEVWDGELLVGGLYGVALGCCFFGESMFHRRNDASKIALVALCAELFGAGYVMIDMQLPTQHLLSLGGRLLDRARFDALLQAGGTATFALDSPPFFPAKPVGSKTPFLSVF